VTIDDNNLVQVLPQRTHPQMQMSAASGYLLSGIKIVDLKKNEKTSNNMGKMQSEIHQGTKESQDKITPPSFKKLRTE
jgi:hypothetical protein